MKIVDKRSNMTSVFEDLLIGDFFYFKGDLYIKILRNSGLNLENKNIEDFGDNINIEFIDDENIYIEIKG